tara:strand:+ start:152 stop:1219 length:1068 start_codon:yes stop_codon:yes gene_type:complete
MKRKNLSASQIIHKFFLNKLDDPKIKKIYLKFKKNLNNFSNNKFGVMVSGGPDSLALAFLAKYYSISERVSVYFYIVDHRLRKEGFSEALLTKKTLKQFDIKCEILRLKEKKYNKNIQSQARERRYTLVSDISSKNKIKYLLTAHHKDDLIENFFIRFLRGSGLRGLSSFSKTINTLEFNKKNKKINILRPLLSFTKDELLYITNNTFNFYINDSSNKNEQFLRIRIRNLLKKLKSEGLNFKKFSDTINNLASSNEVIEFYVKKNIYENTNFFLKEKKIILNDIFFRQPGEIVFRSLNQILLFIGGKTNFSRGKKLKSLIQKLVLKSNKLRFTLSGCLIEKINNSVIIRPEIKKK